MKDSPGLPGSSRPPRQTLIIATMGYRVHMKDKGFCLMQKIFFPSFLSHPHSISSQMGPPLIFPTTDSSVIPLKRAVLWSSLQIFGSDEKVQTSQLSTDRENMRNRFTNSEVILLHRSAVGLSQDSQKSHRLVWIPVPFDHKKVFTFRDYRSLAVSRSIWTVPILRIR